MPPAVINNDNCTKLSLGGVTADQREAARWGHFELAAFTASGATPLVR